MEDKTNYTQSSDIIRRVYYSIKSNWLLITIIVAIAIAIGVVISYFQVPIYTATCKTIYKASAFIDDNGDGEMSEEEEAKLGKYDNITLTNRYLTTVVDFCKQGCVADRANYYYNDYINNKDIYPTVNDYIDWLDKEFKAKEDKYLDKINESKKKDEDFLSTLPQEIVMSGITIKQPDEESFVVNVSYTDENIDVVTDKVLLVYAAINREAKVKTTVDEATFFKYFYNAEVNLTNTTLMPTPYNSVNRKKTVLIAAVVGAVVSLVAVYVENMFNRTIRSRSELESCTGAGFLAYIDDQGE